MLTKKQKVGAVALPLMIAIGFGLAKVTTDPKTIASISLAAFVGAFLSTIWGRKRHQVTFGRMTLIALVVAGVAAAMLVISNLLARL
jgi:hypothetical protein